MTLRYAMPSMPRQMPLIASLIALFALCFVVLPPQSASAAPDARSTDAEIETDAVSPEMAAVLAHANAAQAAIDADDFPTAAASWVAAVDGLGPAGEDPAEYGGLVAIAAYAAVSQLAIGEATRMVALVARAPAAALVDEMPDLAEAAALRSREAGEAGEAAAGLALVDATLAAAERHLGPLGAWTVKLHLARAGLLLALGQHAAAIEAAGVTLDRGPAAGIEPELIAAAARMQGQALNATGRLEEAIAALEASVAWGRGAVAGDGSELAEALHILADLREQAERWLDARAAYADAHAIRLALFGEWHPATALAGCHLDLLRGTEGAILSPDPVDCERLLMIESRGLGEHGRVARAHGLLARAWQARARPGEASPHLDAALWLRSVVPGDPDDLAGALRRRAGLDLLIGAEALGRALMVEGLAIIDALGDASERALWLHDLAAIESRMGDDAAAGRHLDAALALDPPGIERVAVLMARAVLLDDAGQAAEARPFFDEAATLLGARPDHAFAGYWQVRMSDNALRLGETQRSRTLALAALAAVERRATTEFRWEVLTRYALSAYVEDHNTVAIFYAKRAVDALQAMRGDLAERAAGFVAGFQTHYQSLAELLVEERGRLAEAQVVTGMLRAAELAEYTRGASAADRGAPVPRTPVERRWLDRYEAAVARLRAVDEPASRASAEAGFIAAVEALEAEMSAAEAAGQRSFDAETVAALHAQQKLLATLDAGRAGRTALVHVMLGRDATHLLVTTAARQWFYRSPLDRTAINVRADALHRALRDRGAWRAASEALYTDLVAPLRDELRADRVDTLLWSLDGALRYVPMAALVDPATGRFLVEDFAIARFSDPVAEVFDRPRRAPDRVAAFGAAAGAPSLSLAPLPGVRLELDLIVRSGAEAKGGDAIGVMPGSVAIDDAFTESALFAGLGDAPVVHIASHFVFEPGPVDASYLLLGDGRALSLAAFSDVRLDGIELLVLSACQTAVGTFAEGQPLDGFASLALQRGARSVVASLWPVLDDSAAELMAQFYARIAAGDRKVDALRAAQRAMLGSVARGGGGTRKLTLPGAMPDAMGGSAGATADAMPHPYTWAPFVLVGDPR